MVENESNADPSLDKEQLEKVKTALEGFDISGLKSLVHVEAMLKIRDPLERLKYLSDHQEALEADREAITQHLARKSPSEQS